VFFSLFWSLYQAQNINFVRISFKKNIDIFAILDPDPFSPTQLNPHPIRMYASYLDLVMVGLRRWWASSLAALGRAAGSGWTISRSRLFSSREYSLNYSSSPRCIREYTGSSRLFLFKGKGALPKKAEPNFNLQSLHL
jgi:hypothetical protein